MNKISAFFTVFLTVFLAEIGDKTQLATMLFATKEDYPKVVVFMGAALALCLAAFVGVMAGAMIEALLPRKVIAILAGGGFIIIGLFILIKGL